MTQHQEIRNILTHFSFSDPEISVYLATLSLTNPSVTEIAKKAELNRTAAYFHIKNLLKKGVLQETRKGRTLHFVATPPSHITGNIEKLLTNLKGFLPQLESLQTQEHHKPLIEMTESKTGYFKVYDHLSSLPPGSTFRVIEGKKPTELEFSLLTEEQWTTFFTRVIERNITTKAIFTKECFDVPDTSFSKKTAQIFRDRTWDLRMLPESILPLDDLAFIYENKVSILFPDSAFVLTITHPGVAKIFATIFDALFHFAEPQPNGWSTKKTVDPI